MSVEPGPPCGMSIRIRNVSGPQTEEFLQELTRFTTHCVSVKQEAGACNLGGGVSGSLVGFGKHGRLTTVWFLKLQS